MEALFRRLLAGIPHDWHRRNDIARYEGYWSSVFYAFFQAVMDGVAVEEATSRGRLDLAVRLGTNVYLFEFKVAERSTAGAALAQLQARGYAEKHSAPGLAVHLIGVEISAETRDVVAFEGGHVLWRPWRTQPQGMRSPAASGAPFPWRIGRHDLGGRAARGASESQSRSAA